MIRKLISQKLLFFVSVVAFAIMPTASRSASACDGSLCDTAQSLQALTAYEKQVDAWARMPHDPFPALHFGAPHYGGLPLTFRDKQRAEDHVDTWNYYDEEVAFEKLHPGDAQTNFPSFESLIYHAIGSVYNRLTPDGIDSVSLAPGRALWTESDSRKLLAKVGITDPSILTFLRDIRYGDYGVKLYAAKNYRLTSQPDTSGVELMIVADYAFDVLTEEDATGNVSDADLRAARAIHEHISPADLRRTGGDGFYDGMYSEICQAVLDRELILDGRLSYTFNMGGGASNSAPLQSVPASSASAFQPLLRSASNIPARLLAFVAFVDRVYSQSVSTLSDLAVMGQGARLYAPWSEDDTDQLLTSMDAIVGSKALSLVLKAYSVGKFAGTEMAIKNDKKLKSRPQFRDHVQKALAAEWAIGIGLEKYGHDSELAPVGDFSTYAAWSKQLREKFIVTLTAEEQEYLDELNEAVDIVELIKHATASKS